MNPNALTRDGLRDAPGEAKRQQLPLVVTDRNRISRVKGEAERIVREHDVCIICIEDGFLPLSELPSKDGRRGERFAEKVSDRTKKALATRNAKGVQLGSPNLPAVRRLAAIAKRVAFDDLVREMVRVLRVEDPTAKLTAREVVDLFNRRGLLSGGGRPWTISGIRRPLRAAREKIALENEVAEELEATGVS